MHAGKVAGNYIQSVTGAVVTINGQPHTAPLIVSADSILGGWTPGTVRDLCLEDFRAALDLQPEVILLGTGATHQFADNRLATAIMSAGIGFEVMTTPAACRTYNVLLAEDRRVVAALLPT